MNMITFKSRDVGCSLSHIPYVSRGYGLRSYMKVIRSRSRSRSQEPERSKIPIPIYGARFCDFFSICNVYGTISKQLLVVFDHRCREYVGCKQCGRDSWTQYMNQAATGVDTSTTTSDSWMHAFSGLVTANSAEVDAGATATRCRSLTTISVSDLDQLYSYTGQSCYDPSPADRTHVPESTVAASRQRLSGLPLKHRYKQTSKNQSATSCRRW